YRQNICAGGAGRGGGGYKHARACRHISGPRITFYSEWWSLGQNQLKTPDLVYLVCVFLCLVASSSLFPPCLKSSSVSHDFHSSSDNEPCLYNRLRVCLLLAGTAASSNYYPCDDPGLDKRRSPLPIPDWICFFILDCLTVYRTRSVKLVNLHLCLRVEHLDPTFPRSLLMVD